MRKLAAALWFSITISGSQAEQPPAAQSGLESNRSDVSQILEALDALFILQDATANGIRSAAGYQKSLILNIGEQITRRNEDDLNQIAPQIAAYVLSGGDPRTANNLAKSTTLINQHRLLLEGVSLFMQGELGKSQELLGDIDVNTLPARVAGRVALAQAMLEKSPTVRQEFFSVAAAFMPGTLVEESALRRSAMYYAEDIQESSLLRRLERYQRRFPESLYARSFWEAILSELSKWEAKGKTLDIERLDLILNEMSMDHRRKLYLHLARQSSRWGSVDLVSQGARRALRLSAEGGLEEQIAWLYLSLYSIDSGSDKLVAELISINRNILDTTDRALLDARLWIGRQINLPPSAVRKENLEEPSEKTVLQVKAEELLLDVDRVLAESRT